MPTLLLFLLLQPTPPVANAALTLSWDQAAPDLATAQRYVYLHFDDGAAAGVAFPTVTCAAKTPAVAQLFDCSAPFPPFTPGAHTIALVARDGTVDSAKSSAFAFTFVVVPAEPVNLRIGS